MRAQRTFKVTIPATSTVYVDLGLLYSAANHRMMRQNYVHRAKFHVDGLVPPGAGDEVFSIMALPNTWPVINAFKHARGVFQKALTPESAGTKKARWHDFKVYFDTAHKAQDDAGVLGTQGKMLPIGVNMDFTPGTGNADFVYSVVLDDAGANSYTWHMLGNSVVTGANRSFGCIDEYDITDDTSADQAAGTTEYDLILNDVNSDNESNLQNDGNLPPYNKDQLQIASFSETIHATTAAGYGHNRLSTGYVDVPFGLVRITNEVAGDRSIFITLQSGKVKGINAEVI